MAKPKKQRKRLIWPPHASLIAGVDEVGRGPLAGPILAAAVILDPTRRIPGLADSKALTGAQREKLFPIIQKKAVAWAIGRAEVEEIDQFNIFQAGLLAMKRAIMALPTIPSHVQIDGMHCPDIPYSAEAIVDGDQKVAAISAASIIAKVIRDREMVELDKLFPGYGLAEHKGYSTKKHKEALKALGASKVHRQSFTPVRGVVFPIVDLLEEVQ